MTPPNPHEDDSAPLIPRLRVIRDLCAQILTTVQGQAAGVESARADIARLQADIDTAGFSLTAIQTTVDQILKNQTAGRAVGFAVTGTTVPATPPAPPEDIAPPKDTTP